MRRLTIKQMRVFDILKTYFAAQNQSPTLEELRQLLKLRSLRTVTQYLEALENSGYIVRRKGVKRNIELLHTDSEGRYNQTISIPIIASVGCDNLSVFAQETYDEYIEVDKAITSKVNDEIVGVRAIGDSMADAGINSGDYILIQFTENVQSGDRVAAIVNDMITVKRLEKRDGLLILWPESKDPKYTPVILSENFKITGKVLCVIPNQNSEITEVVPL